MELATVPERDAGFAAGAGRLTRFAAGCAARSPAIAAGAVAAFLLLRAFFSAFVRILAALSALLAARRASRLVCLARFLAFLRSSFALRNRSRTCSSA